jgi:hypothetical protein
MEWRRMSIVPVPPSGTRAATVGERAAFVAAATGTAAEQLKPLPYVFASEVTGTVTTGELVEGLLAIGGMSVVYGESGSGKTYLALDIACRLALGKPWLGRRTRQGIVVYVAAEAGASILNRVLAFKRHHAVESLPLALVTCPVDLLDPMADTRRLITMTGAIQAERGEPVKLVIIDTLSRAMAGGNENAPDDMGALVMNSDRVRHQTCAHVLWVHHSGKDSAKGARGHSLLRAAADTEIEVGGRDGVHRVLVTKQRDGPGGAEFSFTLRPIVLGENEWGGLQVACVLEPGGAGACSAAEAHPAAQRLPHRAAGAARGHPRPRPAATCHQRHTTGQARGYRRALAAALLHDGNVGSGR